MSYIFKLRFISKSIVAIAIGIFIRSWMAHGIWKGRPESIPPPQYPSGNRTAIMLTGQLRTGNMSWASGLIRSDRSKMFSSEDPSTPILTQLEQLIEPIARFGGVDMFIYMQVDPRLDISRNASLWDGNLQTFEPTVGDTKICELYSKDPIFAPSTGNKVFCLVEYEIRRTSPLLEDALFWKFYVYNKKSVGENNARLAKDQLLQQLYAMYRANLGCKQYSVAANVQYKYKIRLRPDIGFMKPIPLIYNFVYRNRTVDNKYCEKVIVFSNKVIYSYGAEDSFNLGLSEDMDKLLDRYEVMISGSTGYWFGNVWGAESFMTDLIGRRYGICIASESDIWLVLVRSLHHTLSFKEAMDDKNYWKESPYFNST